MASPYARILRPPHVAAPVGSALLHGVAAALAPRPLVLLVADRTGSYATAGAVSAINLAAGALAAPMWGRQVDRRGPVAVVLPLSALAALAFWSLVAADA